MGRRHDSPFMWIRSPIKNFCYVFCKRYRYKIICLLMTLLLAMILFNFIYSAPVSAKHWGRDKGTGHSCVSSDSTFRFLL
ncbi:Fer-1-like protein 5 [Cricetulus griseus]|uniref:Fer-1-like protein 5 n=1 Tax=Cricetulus griseus TaxID=10029 RepID=G3H1R6_CRIGR|nr:Fer-1-like protein 5 [Cricetulus griseus]